ncbi:MAG: hypothetical protein ACRERC_09345 [Candidatus Binatia bacterium]
MSDEEVRRYAERVRFTAATRDDWLARPAVERDALLELAGRLRLGENQFRAVLDDLTAIAARQQVGLADVIAGAPIQAVLQRGLGRNEAIKALKLALRRVRMPQLTAAEGRMAALVRQLGLPAGVRVELPPELEGDRITVALRASSAGELRAQAAALAAALRSGALDEMFAVLEGRW